MKTYDQFTSEDIRSENKNKPHLQLGDILDINFGHVAEGSKIFAKVIKLFIPGGIARYESIICNRVPYLCDHKFESIVDAFNISLKADMDLYKYKMRENIPKISEEDGEENWDDDFINEKNTDIDPFEEEDWDCDKRLDYINFKGTLLEFLEQIDSNDYTMINNLVNLLKDKEFMKNANKCNIIIDLLYILRKEGVDDKSLNKIEDELLVQF